ncbi:hypothetical protein EP7_005290 [Isosphaeraceae bacterium EP7]
MHTLVVLTGRQVGELTHILCQLFNLAELTRLTRTHLELDLEVEIATPKTGLLEVAYNLISHLDRHGRVDQFLGAVTAERPLDDGLRQFIGRIRGDAQSPPIEKQISEVNEALEAVAKRAKADPAVQAALGETKAQFKIVRDELTYLARYKALHDCLHTLQMQLTAVSRAAQAFPDDPTAGRDLVAFADQLQRQARRARKAIGGLLSEAEETIWVDEFDQALVAAREAVRAVDGAPLTAAVEALAQLLPQSIRINDQMIGAARRLGLQLDPLATTMSSLASGTDGGVADRLKAGAIALRGLTPQLVGLTSVHDIWQKIDSALTTAEAFPNASPARRVPRWPRVKADIARVCPPGSALDPAADPVALTEGLEQATDLATSENIFLTLRAASRHEFKDVDDRLLDLAEQLTETIGNLNILLGVI